LVTAVDEAAARVAVTPELAVCTKADMDNMSTDGIDAADFAYRICGVEILEDDVDAPASIKFQRAGLNG
jgi:hypothetical protein